MARANPRSGRASRRLIAAAVASIAVFIAGCGGGGSGPSPSPALVSVIVTVTVAPTTAGAQAGLGAVAFVASVAGSANSAVTWQVDGVTGGNSAAGTISSVGLYTAPADVPAPATVTVTAVSMADPTRSASATVTIGAPVTVTISAAAPSLQGGMDTVAFSATVANSSNSAVTWSVDDVMGGSPNLGTISTTGLYTAPAAVPTPAAVTIRATSVADPARSAVSTLVITSPGRVGATVTVALVGSSAYAEAGSGTVTFTATVTNTSNLAVTWQVNGVDGGSAVAGTISPAGVYHAPAVVPTPAVVTIVAVSVADPSQSASALVTVTDPAVAVSVTPRRAGVTTGESQTFTATVTGQSILSVTWSVDGTTGGSAATGTISSTGVYSPPSTAGVHQVAASSVANPAKTALASAAVTDLAGIYMHHGDLARTGQNLREFALTPTLVGTPGAFGRVFQCAIDGQAYAQPLYVANFAIGGGIHNVVFVATEHDSVYAFDADAAPCVQYWQTSFLGTGVTSVPAVDTGSPQLVPEIGITGTPVIDGGTNTLYVIARTKELAAYHQRLHALDLATGHEKTGGSFPGTGSEITATIPLNGSTVTFDPLFQNQRAALTLANGRVYAAWGSHSDNGNFHGWVLAYDAATLTQSAVFNVTPHGWAGGIWMAGAGLAVDSSGSLYFSTGNGTFDDATGAVPPLSPGDDFGESFLRLDGVSLAVQDFYTPSQDVAWSDLDLDLASAGVLVLPDGAGPTNHPNLLVGLDKQAHLWLLDRTNMSRYTLGLDNVVQMLTLPYSDGGCQPYTCVVASPAYWNGSLYVAVTNGPVMALPITAGLFGSSGMTGIASSRSAENYQYPGPTPTVSAAGNLKAIVWALDNNANGTGDGSSAPGAAILRAYDATNLATTLYSSDAVPGDAAGLAVKFTLPVVANGKVYVGGDHLLTVYGLLP
jgi:hypothetical protein